jgi:hypothetical protein
MGNNKFWLGLLVGAVIVGLIWFLTTRPEGATTSPVASEAEAVSIDVEFLNHIQAGLPEQDVFTESADNPATVVRVDVEGAKQAANLSRTAFASADPVEHDPFQLGENPLGPYSKGGSLGITLDEWLAATGSGTYTLKGDEAEVDLSFQKLVANGVYTVWCSRLTFPPNVAVVDRPCGEVDGSENVFTADGQGNGKFKLKMAPLEKSTKETASVIALAYHSDGKTYGPNPGDFGSKTHVHIFYLLPAGE